MTKTNLTGTYQGRKWWSNRSALYFTEKKLYSDAEAVEVDVAFILDAKFEVGAIVEKRELYQALQRALPFAKDNADSVIIGAAHNCLSVSAKSQERGDVVSDIPASSVNLPGVTVNAQYLLKALTLFKAGPVRILYSTDGMLYLQEYRGRLDVGAYIMPLTIPGAKHTLPNVKGWEVVRYPEARTGVIEGNRSPKPKSGKLFNRGAYSLARELEIDTPRLTFEFEASPHKYGATKSDPGNLTLMAKTAPQADNFFWYPETLIPMRRRNLKAQLKNWGWRYANALKKAKTATESLVEFYRVSARDYRVEIQSLQAELKELTS